MTAITTGTESPSVGNRINWQPPFTYFMVNYKRRWRGSLVANFGEPVLFLAAMGLGLGSYVHGQHHDVDGVSYLQFLAPGLLAATAMQTGMAESSWPVYDAVMWIKSYFSMLSAPLRIIDVVAGHFVFMVMRIAMSVVVFMLVMTAFGAVHSATGAVLAVPCAILTGAVFASFISAYCVCLKADAGIALLYRLGLMPLFLFSGTFFPLSQLPAAIRPLAWITPLWHGVTLCRDLVLGRGTTLELLGHVAYLLALLPIGLWLAHRNYSRRLTW